MQSEQKLDWRKILGNGKRARESISLEFGSDGTYILVDVSMVWKKTRNQLKSI